MAVIVLQLQQRDCNKSFRQWLINHIDLAVGFCCQCRPLFKWTELNWTAQWFIDLLNWIDNCLIDSFLIWFWFVCLCFFFVATFFFGRSNAPDDHRDVRVLRRCAARDRRRPQISHRRLSRTGHTASGSGAPRSTGHSAAAGRIQSAGICHSNQTRSG